MERPRKRIVRAVRESGKSARRQNHRRRENVLPDTGADAKRMHARRRHQRRAVPDGTVRRNRSGAADYGRAGDVELVIEF